MNRHNRGGPLQGVRVVELTKVWAGPYTGKLLAFLGAEVIRIESEKSLDITRVYGVKDINDAPGFKAVNPQKLSVQIDMKTRSGVELILDLLGKSDVLIENLRPGAVKRLGLDYDAVKAAKPDIIYTSMSMHGNGGPLSYQTGYAPCFAALSGLSALVGERGQPPAGMNVRYADSTFGAAAAFATIAALFHHRRTGQGQYIDVSAVESMSSMIGDELMNHSLNGIIQACQGNWHPEMAPHGVYPCAHNEWISIAVNSDANWMQLTRAINKPELAQDRRFSTLASRKNNEDALDDLLAAWTQTQDAQSLVTLLQSFGVAAAKSATSMDLVSDSHLWGREFYQQVNESNGDSRPIVGPGWKMSRGAAITTGAPRLGEHNDYVLGDILKLSKNEQEELAKASITR